MKQNIDLPEWCRILEGLISEEAEERGEDPEDYKEAILAKSKEGMDAGTPTPASSENQHRTQEAIAK